MTRQPTYNNNKKCASCGLLVADQNTYCCKACFDKGENTSVSEVKKVIQQKISIIRIEWNNPYECPETGEGCEPNYCDSFCFGTGCRYLKTCSAYNENKKV